MTVQQFNTSVSILFVGYSKNAPNLFTPISVSVLKWELTNWYSPDASPVQSRRLQDQVSCNLHLFSGSSLGSHFRMHSSGKLLWRIVGLPVHAWVC